MASNFPDVSREFLEQPVWFQQFLRVWITPNAWNAASESERCEFVEIYETAKRMARRAEILEAARHD